MHTKKSRKVNIPIRIAGIMLCLALFSVYMTSGMFARYATGGSTSDNGRIAKLNVSAEGAVGGTGENGAAPEMEFIQAEGEFVADNNTYVVTVKNLSETAVRYSIELVFPEGVTNYLTVRRGNDTLAADGNRITCPGSDIAPAGGTVAETLTFVIGDEFYALDTNTEDHLTTGDVEIAFDALVTFVQID